MPSIEKERTGVGVTTAGYRIERDSLGEVRVPVDALHGAQTQRALDNFDFSERRMPALMIRAIGLVKASAAQVNGELGLLNPRKAAAIIEVAQRIATGELDQAFPVDVFQTGSGTSFNMNANEVIARLASEAGGFEVHPNDDVNRCQSSNDVVPSCIRIAAVLGIVERLNPALESLEASLGERMRALRSVTKTGRTHLMDAMPLTFAQELSGWQAQMTASRQRIGGCLGRLLALPQGGTAIGTGVNAHPEFALRFAQRLSSTTGQAFVPKSSFFEGISSIDDVVELHGQLKTLAVALMKIGNDLRWMSSGPLAGLAEISLPALQPGSSIMPGKVNPVIPEAITMICAQVIGNDTTVTIAGQSGNFQLNCMLPVAASNTCESLGLLTAGVTALSERVIPGMQPDVASLSESLRRNPILATALNERFGYDRVAEIVKQAWSQRRPIVDVAEELSGLDRDELERLLDPVRLTGESTPER